ncbi:hypothetical protein MHBO_000212 [Bonamia ostreae]|uniref:Matrin-type domain-containing protein n=1 Tax=Bonamia ostreae TaxID=126728 RepID=A0ABV2AEU7_9EUKA
MGRFYCEYCDIFLTHDSTGGRKQHMHGRKHYDNVRQYYSRYLPQTSFPNIVSPFMMGPGPNAGMPPVGVLGAQGLPLSFPGGPPPPFPMQPGMVPNFAPGMMPPTMPNFNPNQTNK